MPKHTEAVETLSEYVKRIMDEKQLSALDVEARSGKKIADSYITNILHGSAKNPSVEKLKALAEGLSVDEDEIFLVARGIAPGSKRAGEPLPSLLLVRSIEKILLNPDLTKILKAIPTLNQAKIKAILKSIESEKD